MLFVACRKCFLLSYSFAAFNRLSLSSEHWRGRENGGDTPSSMNFPYASTPSNDSLVVDPAIRTAFQWTDSMSSKLNERSLRTHHSSTSDNQVHGEHKLDDEDWRDETPPPVKLMEIDPRLRDYPQDYKKLKHDENFLLKQVSCCVDCCLHMNASMLKFVESDLVIDFMRYSEAPEELRAKFVFLLPPPFFLFVLLPYFNL